MTDHARFNGQTIAESDHTIVVEGNHYFPVDDVRDELLHATSSRTLCPWKGIANYWTVEVDGVHAKNAAWGYRRPWPSTPTDLNRHARPTPGGFACPIGRRRSAVARRSAGRGAGRRGYAASQHHAIRCRHGGGARRGRGVADRRNELKVVGP